MMTQVLGPTSALMNVSVAARIAERRIDAGLVKAPRERPAFDDELDFEAG